MVVSLQRVLQAYDSLATVEHRGREASLAHYSIVVTVGCWYHCLPITSGHHRYHALPSSHVISHIHISHISPATDCHNHTNTNLCASSVWKSSVNVNLCIYGK